MGYLMKVGRREDKKDVVCYSPLIQLCTCFFEQVVMGFLLPGEVASFVDRQVL